MRTTLSNRKCRRRGSAFLAKALDKRKRKAPLPSSSLIAVVGVSPQFRVLVSGPYPTLIHLTVRKMEEFNNMRPTGGTPELIQEKVIDWGSFGVVFEVTLRVHLIHFTDHPSYSIIFLERYVCPTLNR